MGRGILDLRKRLAEGLRPNSTKSKQPSAPAPTPTSSYSHTVTLELANAAVVLHDPPAAIHIRDYTHPSGQSVVPPPSAASSAATKRTHVSPSIVVSAGTSAGTSIPPPPLPPRRTSMPPLLPSSKRSAIPPHPPAAAQIKAALAVPQHPTAMRASPVNYTLAQLVGPPPTELRSSPSSSSGATARPSPAVPTAMTSDQSRPSTRTSGMSALTNFGSSLAPPPVRPSSAAVRPSSATAAPVITRPTSVPVAPAPLRPQSILVSKPRADVVTRSSQPFPTSTTPPESHVPPPAAPLSHSRTPVSSATSSRIPIVRSTSGTRATTQVSSPSSDESTRSCLKRERAISQEHTQVLHTDDDVRRVRFRQGTKVEDGAPKANRLSRLLSRRTRTSDPDKMAVDRESTAAPPPIKQRGVPTSVHTSFNAQQHPRVNSAPPAPLSPDLGGFALETFGRYAREVDRAPFVKPTTAPSGYVPTRTWMVQAGPSNGSGSSPDLATGLTADSTRVAKQTSHVPTPVEARYLYPNRTAQPIGADFGQTEARMPLRIVSDVRGAETLDQWMNGARYSRKRGS